jgi:hypothetical protein
MPRKEFDAFTRLDASDVNSFLMDQSVMTFGGTAARGSAIPTPVEGMVTYLEDSNSLQLYDGSGWTAAGGASSGNFIINGAMQVAQRGTAKTGITDSGYTTADRWTSFIATLGTWTHTVENDAPTGSGFAKSFKILCTTADNTPAAADLYQFIQPLEGQNLQSIRKGTASAQELTVSFWVKSNVTGTYITELVDADNTRQVSAAYTIASSATWEKKTVVFPADITGVLDNDNNVSLRLNFILGAGTNYTSGTLNTTWASTTNANRYVGQTNLAAATNNYWQITGVQLELGNVASDFDFQDIQSELAACQRYYYRQGGQDVFQFLGIAQSTSATASLAQIVLPVTMRVPATSVEFSTLQVGDTVGTLFPVTACTLTRPSTTVVPVSLTSTGTMTFQRSYAFGINNSLSGFLAFSSEL